MRSLLAIVWAVLAALLGWFAATVKAPQIQDDILTRTREVVAPLNAGAEVVVDGRFVTVKGPEPDDASKLKTLDAARAVYGALGPWDGLWVPKAVAAVAPMLTAVKQSGGALALTGAVASDAVRTAIADAAKAAFAGAIDNRITVSPAASAGALPDLAEAFGALARLDSGSAVMSPDSVLLSGSTADKAVADAAAALAGKPGWILNVAGPAGDPSAARVAELEAALAKAEADQKAAVAKAGEAEASATRLADEAAALRNRIAELEKAAAGGGEVADKLVADLDAARKALAAAEADLAAAKQATAECTARVEGADKAATDAKAALDAANARIAELEAKLAASAPAAPSAPAGAPTTIEACDAAMVAAVGQGAINFETGSAVIARDAASTLDAVAAASLPCVRDAKLRVDIGGHTDNRGNADDNLRLSQRRADAVRDALVLRNVPADAVRATGYGAAQPVGDNATEEGRAANRRIEFKWSAQ